LLGKFWVTKKFTRLMFGYKSDKLKQNLFGLKFVNPIGLAAGFDKNVMLVDILGDVGFSFSEEGSITGEPCPGNARRPRMWRLKKSKSLLIFYGLMNPGCEKVARKLRGKKTDIVVGVSVAKTNDETTIETQAGIADYKKAYSAFRRVGDFVVVNISCPNAFGGEPFTDAERLELLLKELYTVKMNKPVFIKMSPDLNKRQVDEVIALARKYKIDGFVLCNLTKKINSNLVDEKPFEKGGMSGKVVKDLAMAMVKYVYSKTRGEFLIVGCGGISSAEDAYQYIKNGASLVEMITGMIYEGPQVLSEINQGLVELLKKDGFEHLSDAVGTGVEQ
jgi:dihydroorotate dehydrogenase